MDARLREAAEKGDTNALYECIRHDPNVLRRFDEVEFVDTPLHVAAAKGHANFAIAIMNLRSSFARKLNQDVYSPIHLGLQNGHETTVLRVFEADRNLVRVKGKEGYTILHQAAEKGNLQLLTEFLKHCPASIEDVTIRNETALHIAAKNNRFEALELLARWLQRTHLYSKVSRKYLLNSKDSDGNTVLHIAAYPIQPQMIKILVECGADSMATNMNYRTALDIIENQRINTHDKDMSLKILHHGRGGFRFYMNCLKPRGIKPLHELLRSKISFGERIIMGFKLPLLNLSPERINLLLVVLALILTSAFQSVYSPPGGVWQGDCSQATSAGANYTLVGTSIMSSSNFSTFNFLNYSVVSITSFLMISLLEFGSVGSIIMVPVEILLSSFICCFLFATSVLYPSIEEKSTGSNVKNIFGGFLAMELVRRSLRFLSMTRYESMTSSFREM